MSTRICISVTGYVTLADIVPNFICLLLILHFLHSQQLPQQDLVLFLEEQSIPLVLKGLDPLTSCLDLVVVFSP